MINTSFAYISRKSAFGRFFCSLRQRKEQAVLCLYAGGMDFSAFTPTTTVQTVFKILPDASSIFIQHKTACVGCPLTRFCTLQEVATIYAIDLHFLLHDLEQALAQ